MCSKAPDYGKLFYNIKKRCQFQKNFSGLLLIIFFVLQYSVPISLVMLGSITSSKDSLTTLVQTNFFPNKELDKPETKLANRNAADACVTQIIFLLSVLTILLGVINTTVRPAESYDTSSKFNNKFAKFEDELDLGLLALGAFPEDLSTDNPKFINFLGEKIKALTELIDEYNEARSLSPRQANKEAVEQITDR